MVVTNFFDRYENNSEIIILSKHMHKKKEKQNKKTLIQ